MATRAFVSSCVACLACRTTHDFAVACMGSVTTELSDITGATGKKA